MFNSKNNELIELLKESEASNKILLQTVIGLNKTCALLEKRTRHLYMLLDLMGSDLPPNSMFDVIRMVPITEIPDTEAAQTNFVLKKTSEIYLARRNNLIDIIERTENEEEKNLYKNNLTELDNIYNLLCTVDENSDPDYVKSISIELKACLSRMNDFRKPI